MSFTIDLSSVINWWAELSYTMQLVYGISAYLVCGLLMARFMYWYNIRDISNIGEAISIVGWTIVAWPIIMILTIIYITMPVVYAIVTFGIDKPRGT